MSEYIVIGTIIAAFAVAAVLSYFFTPPVKMCIRDSTLRSRSRSASGPFCGRSRNGRNSFNRVRSGDWRVKRFSEASLCLLYTSDCWNTSFFFCFRVLFRRVVSFIWAAVRYDFVQIDRHEMCIRDRNWIFCSFWNCSKRDYKTVFDTDFPIF